MIKYPLLTENTMRSSGWNTHPRFPRSVRTPIGWPSGRLGDRTQRTTTSKRVVRPISEGSTSLASPGAIWRALKALHDHRKRLSATMIPTAYQENA